MVPEKGRGKRQALLANDDVRRWFENTARGALATADNYLRILGLFLEQVDLSPKAFIELEPKKRDDLLADHIQRMQNEGKAGSYAAVVKKAVASWLDWNGLRFTRRIKVQGVSETPSLADAHIPTQEELRRVLSMADVRAKAAIGLMAFAGVREQVLGSYKGDNGLRLQAFSELDFRELEEGRVVFQEVPTKVTVGRHLSKTRTPHFTFLGPEGCEYLTGYLKKRMDQGEELGPESSVIRPERAKKDFIRSLNIADMIRAPLRRAGINEPPYILRSYFSSRAMLAESQGLSKDWREFFMGHKGGISAVHSLHKILPADAVETMREAYGKALRYLETVPRISAENPRDDVLEVLLTVVGYAPEEIEALDFYEMTKEEIAELIEKAPRKILAENGGGPRQQIISLKNLPTALQEGWLFKANLSDSRVIVEFERPGGA